jgi:hypothetical protein
MESNVSHEVLQAWKSGLDSMIVNIVEVVKELSLSCLNNYLDGTLSPLQRLDQWKLMVDKYPDNTLDEFELNEDLAMMTQCLVKQIAQMMEDFANENDIGFFLEDEICYAGFIARDQMDLMKITNWIYDTLNTDVTLINHKNIPDQLNIIAMSCVLTDKTFKTMNLLMEKYRNEEYYDEDCETLEEEIQEQILSNLEGYEDEEMDNDSDTNEFITRQKETSFLNFNIYENNKEIQKTIQEALMNAKLNKQTEPIYNVKETTRLNRESWSKNWWKQNNSLKLNNKKMTCLNLKIDEIPTTVEKLAVKSALTNTRILLKKLLNETKEIKLCSNYYGNKFGVKMLEENLKVKIFKEKVHAKELKWKNPWCIKKDEILNFLNLKNKWKTKITLTLMLDQK